LTIEAKNRLRHHSATAKQYCPSSSTVARHSTPEHDAGGGGRSFLAVIIQQNRFVRFDVRCSR
jgi:hypothetical protein